MRKLPVSFIVMKRMFVQIVGRLTNWNINNSIRRANPLECLYVFIELRLECPHCTRRNNWHTDTPPFKFAGCILNITVFEDDLMLLRCIFYLVHPSPTDQSYYLRCWRVNSCTAFLDLHKQSLPLSTFLCCPWCLCAWDGCSPLY